MNRHSNALKVWGEMLCDSAVRAGMNTRRMASRNSERRGRELRVRGPSCLRVTASCLMTHARYTRTCLFKPNRNAGRPNQAAYAEASVAASCDISCPALSLVLGVIRNGVRRRAAKDTVRLGVLERLFPESRKNAL
jgi:hypothetical protein